MNCKSTFWTVLQQLSDLMEVPRNEICLSMKEESLSFDETPENLKVTPSDYIDCFRKVKENGPSDSSSKSAEPVDPNSIGVKIRRHVAEKRNHDDITVLRINKLSPFSELMSAYANQIDIPLDKLKFEFDGDVLDGSETAESLDMEDESMIDVRVKSG